MKKIFYICLLAIMSFLIVSGCSSNSSGDGGNESKDSASESLGDSSQDESSEQSEESDDVIELRVAWWGGQERHDRTLKVIDLFEEKYPNIKIVAEYSGFDGYFDKLTTQFAAGNAPDVIQYGGNLNDYVLKDVVLPLDEFVGNQIDISKHSESMLDAATFDGKLYGLTLGTTAWGVLVNKTAFDKTGVSLPSKDWTWEDFRDLTPKLSEGLDGTYGTADFEEDGFGVFLAQRDKFSYLDGEIGFEATDVADWFQLWKDLRESGGAAVPEIQVSASQTPEQSLIVQGDVAIESVASNQYGAYSNATKDEFLLYPYPYDSETGKNGVSLRPSQFFAGNKMTEHPEEVAKFIDFFVNDLEATEILGNDRGAPVNSDVRVNLIDKADEIDQAIFEYIDLVSETSDAPYIPNYPGYNENTQLFKETAEKIYFDQSSVEDAANNYYDKLIDNIKKYTEE
ncbi:ABC transporter substrate-binding protein [Aquibacillus salsiterrae]|uniref:ABC transporter substrate-binding protein n=1 Tax=Aquibacillus salsiterrae TaxID=2950439 RepID=A0A9X4AFG4_9BACI|nr:ABC transporter substrate-binding protein [Aquibacillus salsiterrae]MDC3416003.1 ABC transporter substrate-binding protein [Aquibacillus salsiterrae]